MAEFLIIVVALFFAGMGVYGLAAPGLLVAPFRLTADSATARAEVRAVYGGFGVATAGCSSSPHSMPMASGPSRR